MQKKPASIVLLRHHKSERQRDGRQITTTPELDAAPSLISSFSDLQSSLPEAKPLSLKESDRGNMSSDTRSNSRTDIPPRLQCRGMIAELSASIHKPSIGYAIFHLSHTQTNVCAYS
jgi:hypothetical protein